MNISQFLIRRSLKGVAIVLGALTVSLVSGACHRHVVKYGGPPADYKESGDAYHKKDLDRNPLVLVNEKDKAY